MMNHEENKINDLDTATEVSAEGTPAMDNKTILPTKRGMGNKATDLSLLQPEIQQAGEVEDGWQDGAAEHASPSRATSPKWIGIAVVVVLVVLVGGYFLVGMKGPEVEEVNTKAVEHKSKVVEVPYTVMIERMNKSAASYYGADTIEKKLEFVRHPDRVRPMMERYYKTRELKPLPFKGVSKQVARSIGNRLFWVVVSDSGNEEIKLPGLMMEQTDDGQFLIDWESQVIYQPSDWDTFVKERSTKPHQFRVLVSFPQYQAFYGYEFADYNKYRAYQVNLLNREDMLWAYALIGSDAEQVINHQLQNKANGRPKAQVSVPMILTLSFPENAMSDQCVQIDSLDSAAWLYINDTESKPAEKNAVEKAKTDSDAQ